ncbi:PucR family transcriptional regulator [Amycolatopsis lurida]
MSNSSRDDQFPWRALPPSVASWLRPEIPKVAEEMITAIRREVPAYNRPMSGSFGAGLRLGVEQALRQFVELIADPDAPQAHNTKIFRRLGRGELQEGRSVDALHAAYRVGARVAWRQYANVARRAGFSADTTGILAEAVFTHINDMAAESVKGYTDAQAATANTRQRMRERLLAQLISDTPASWSAVEDLARQARWPLPATAACIAVEPADGAPVEWPALPPAVLQSSDEAEPYLLVPDPDAPGMEASLRAALRGTSAALGLTVPIAMAHHSLRWARRALQLVQRGAISPKPLISCADHLSVLLLLTDEQLAQQVSDRVLRVFRDLTPVQRDRLESTLLAWLTSTGRSAPEVATLLGTHPQTVRYRMHQLMELFGDRLNDPDFRFEAEAALRARTLLGND